MGFIRAVFLLPICLCFPLAYLLQGRIGKMFIYGAIQAGLIFFSITVGFLTLGIGSLAGSIAYLILYWKVYNDVKYYRRY